MTALLTCGSVAVMNDRDAHQTKFHALLQEQIHSEFTNAQQYIASAVYFDGADLRQLAKHFYAQAVEERNHAMMLVQYLLDRDVRVEIPGVDGVRNQFDTPRDALALALDQERAVKEQVEEMALMTSLVRVADRAGANLFDLENFIAREIASPHSASDAPAAAG